MKRQEPRQRTSSTMLIASLVSLVLSCIFLILLFILVLVLVYYSQKQNLSILKNHFVISTIFSLLVTVFSTLVGYSSIKDKIHAQVEAFEKSIRADYENIVDERDSFKERFEALNKETEDNLKWEQHKYCLARMYKVDKDIANRICNATARKLIENEGSLEQAKNSLERRYTDIQRREKLRKVMARFDSNDWNILAGCAAYHGLRKIDIKPNLDEPPNYFLFIDLRLYLEVWLVSTIGNNLSINFPIADVGATYPSTSEPNADVYKRAFVYLKRTFENRNDYLKDNLPDLYKSFTLEDINICKLFVPYIEDLEREVLNFIQNKQKIDSSN